VNGIGKSLQAWYEPVILDGYHIVPAGLIVDFRSTDDDQTSAPSGAGRVKVYELITHLAVGRVVEMHGGHDDPVGKNHGTYRYWLE
jgi:hypothetical protein